MAQASGKPAKASAGSAPTWLLGLACGVLATLATPTFLTAGLLLAPGLLALGLDPVPGKPTARPVLLLGLAASAGPISRLWRLGGDMDMAISLFTDPSVLATSWVAQAAGWLVVEIAPLFITLVLEAVARARAARLRAVRKRYEEAWDMGDGGDDAVES